MLMESNVLEMKEGTLPLPLLLSLSLFFLFFTLAWLSVFLVINSLFVSFLLSSSASLPPAPFASLFFPPASLSSAPSGETDPSASQASQQ